MCWGLFPPSPGGLTVGTLFWNSSMNYASAFGNPECLFVFIQGVSMSCPPRLFICGTEPSISLSRIFPSPQTKKLEGKVFCFAGSFEISRMELDALMVMHGARITTEFNDTVTHVVASGKGALLRRSPTSCPPPPKPKMTDPPGGGGSVTWWDPCRVRILYKSCLNSSLISA